ncbi:MAG: hypothetical protein M1457_11305 [bacterium]|nr:hypothetical protein [bacterium]
MGLILAAMMLLTARSGHGEATGGRPDSPRVNLLDAAGAGVWTIQRLDATSTMTLGTIDGAGRLPGGGGLIALTARLPVVGRILADRQVAVHPRPGEIYRFSALVTTRGLRDSHGDSRPNPYRLNLGLSGCCLAFSQLDGRGRPLSEVASRVVLGVNDDAPLALETVIQPGAEVLAVQCRMIGVAGEARFSAPVVECLAPAGLSPLPDARIVTGTMGAPFLQVDGRSIPWYVYFGNNQFGKDDVILDEMKKAVGAGVRIVSFNLHLPCTASNDAILATIGRFLDPHPGVYFLPRVWVGPYPGWLESRPGEKVRYADGATTRFASPASAAWRDCAAANLEELIRLIRRSPYAGRLIGLIPTYYQTGEWIVWGPDRAAGFETPVRGAFETWLRQRYGSVDRLGAAWGRPIGRFQDAAVPGPEARDAAPLGSFRDPIAQRPAIDFARFYGRLVPGLLDRFGAAVRRAGDGRGLTGAFYGYTFEIANLIRWPQNSGHLGLDEFLVSPNLGFFGSPYSYDPDSRAIGLPVMVHGPNDSGQLHARPAMMEEDTFTHLAEKPGPAAMAPGYAQHTTDLPQTLAVLKRNLGCAIAHDYILTWQNLFSEGRFNQPEIWDQYRPYLAWLAAREGCKPPYRPQVAVVIDEDAFALQPADGRAVNARWIHELRSALGRLDTTLGFYLQSDLGRIPDSVRCLILVNPYAITPAQQEELRARWMKDGRMIVFGYLPNVFGDRGLDEHGSAITGMRLALHREPIDIECAVEPRGVLGEFAGQHFSNSADRFNRHWFKDARLGPLAPWMSVDDPQAEVLARYAANGRGACALVRMPGWMSVYLGAPGLTPPMWRRLLREAGCHFFLDDFSTRWDHPDVIQATDDFLMVQSGRDGLRTVRLPRPRARVERFDDTRRLIARNTDRFRDEFKAGVPVFYVLGD